MIHSVWISFFAIVSFILATSILPSLTRTDENKVYTRDTLFYTILQAAWVVWMSLVAVRTINTRVLAASLSARISEPNELFITQSSFFDDQDIGAILFIVPQMIKPPSEDLSFKLA